jgi:uncharacterized metal-binding protein YceD (DUF177 family)
MKILLRKVGKIPLEFEVKSDEITFKGFLQYDADKLILLKAKLSGKVEANCDVCAEEFMLEVDEDIEFFISDGVYEKSEDTFLEVVEVYDSSVDLEELMKSEIELLKSDYHICQTCQSKQDEVLFSIE